MAKKSGNKIFWILGGIMILLLIIVLIKGRSTGGEKVFTDAVQKRDITERVSASGKIYPVIQVPIIPELSGQVVDLYVEEGDSVQKGSPLVRINPDIFEDAVERSQSAVLSARANFENARARAAQAKARLEQAQLEYNRSKKLFDDGVISRADLDAAETNFKVSQSEYQAAQSSVNAAEYNIATASASYRESSTNLQRTTIFSPMAGIVTMLGVEEGRVVGGIAQFASKEIMSIANLDAMEVQVEVIESDILNISIGDTAEIEVDFYDDRKFLGVVTQISAGSGDQSSSAEQATNFPVNIRILPETYADLINPAAKKYPFLPGMSASVEIITQKAHDVLTIPIESVTARNNIFLNADTVAAAQEDKEYVFVVRDGEAKAVTVTTGIQDDTYIEVSSGLKDGDIVIRGPYTSVHTLLRDGDKVSIEDKAGQR